MSPEHINPEFAIPAAFALWCIYLWMRYKQNKEDDK